MTTDIRFADKSVADMVLMYQVLEFRLMEAQDKLQEAERDAARYRWLRDVMNDEIWAVNCTDEHLDAAIDAAMEGRND